MNNIKFAKYSSDRDIKFQTRTVIKSNKGKDEVYKCSLSNEGNAHINNIAKYADILRKNYLNTKISVCECKMDNESTITFEFIGGQSIEKQLDAYLFNGDINQMLALMEDYFKQLGSSENMCEFEKTNEFTSLFSLATFTKKTPCLLFSNIDGIFANVKMVDKNYVFIDYEWCTKATVPLKFIIYRGIFNYLQSSTRILALADINLYKYFKISDGEIKKFEKMEYAFQMYVKGDYIPEEIIENSLKKKTHLYDDLEAVKDTLSRRIQIYVDEGKGFDEERSYFIEHLNDINDKNYFESNIDISKNIKQLRIDPSTNACLLIINKLKSSDDSKKNMDFQHNGLNISEKLILFSDDDPMMIIEASKIYSLKFSGWIIPLSEYSENLIFNHFAETAKKLESNDLAIREMRETYDKNIIDLRNTLLNTYENDKNRMNEIYNKQIEEIKIAHGESIAILQQRFFTRVFRKLGKIFRRDKDSNIG